MTMNFQVETRALRACRARLEELSGDVARAVSYTGSYLHLERGGVGIFQNAVSVNDDARAAVEGALGRLQSVLSESGTELGLVARLYDETDHDVLVRMDAHYEEVEVAEGDRYADNAEPPDDDVPEEPDDDEPPAGIPDDEPEPSPGGGGGSW